MAEEQEIKQEEQTSAKDTWMNNLRGKYPDRKFESEDDYYTASMEGYDAEHDAMKKNKEDNDKLVELLTQNEDVALFIGACLEGNTRKGLAYLSDAIPASETDEGWEEYNNEVTARKNAAKKAEDEKAEYLKNIEESAGVLKEFAEENGMTDEDAMNFVKQMQQEISDKLFSGKIDKDFFQKMYNLINYDNDVAASREAGRIEGRNEKIKAKRAKDVMGSEVPALKSSTSAVDANEKEDNPTLSALRGMSKDYAKRNQYF